MEEKWMVLGVIILGFIVAFFLGWLIGKKTAEHKKFDGTLIIGEEEDREQFRFIFDVELEDLREKHELVMRIQKKQT